MEGLGGNLTVKSGQGHPRAAWSAAGALPETAKGMRHEVPQEEILGLQWPLEKTVFACSSALQTLYNLFLLANSRLERYRNGNRDKCSYWLLLCLRSRRDAKLTTSNQTGASLGQVNVGAGNAAFVIWRGATEACLSMHIRALLQCAQCLLVLLSPVEMANANVLRLRRMESDQRLSKDK